MTDIFDTIFDTMFESLKATNALSEAMIREGVKLGAREMRLKLYPVMRELIDALDQSAPFDGPVREDADELIGRAGELLKDTAPETAASDGAQ